MPYKLTIVCDVCGKEADVPVATLNEVYIVGKMFLSRATAMISTGSDPKKAVKPLCPSCDRTPPVEGTQRVGGGHQLGIAEVKITVGKAKPE